MPDIYCQNIITLGLLVIQKKLIKGFHIFDHCDLDSRSRSFIGGNYIAFHARYLLAKYRHSWPPGYKCLKVFIYLTLVTLKVGQCNLFEETIKHFMQGIY